MSLRKLCVETRPPKKKGSQIPLIPIDCEFRVIQNHLYDTHLPPPPEEAGEPLLRPHPPEPPLPLPLDPLPPGPAPWGPLPLPLPPRPPEGAKPITITKLLLLPRPSLLPLPPLHPSRAPPPPLPLPLRLPHRDPHPPQSPTEEEEGGGSQPCWSRSVGVPS